MLPGTSSHAAVSRAQLNVQQRLGDLQVSGRLHLYADGPTFGVLRRLADHLDDVRRQIGLLGRLHGPFAEGEGGQEPFRLGPEDVVDARCLRPFRAGCCGAMRTTGFASPASGLRYTRGYKPRPRWG